MYSHTYIHWGMGSSVQPSLTYDTKVRIPCSRYGFCFSQCKKDINTFQKRKNINFFMKNSFNSSRTPDVTYFYWFHHYPIYVLYPACHCYLNFHTIPIRSCLQSPYFLWCQKITFWQCLIKHITESFWCSELIHIHHIASVATPTNRDHGMNFSSVIHENRNNTLSSSSRQQHITAGWEIHLIFLLVVI